MLTLKKSLQRGEYSEFVQGQESPQSCCHLNLCNTHLFFTSSRLECFKWLIRLQQGRKKTSSRNCRKWRRSLVDMQQIQGDCNNQGHTFWSCIGTKSTNWKVFHQSKRVLEAICKHENPRVSKNKILRIQLKTWAVRERFRWLWGAGQGKVTHKTCRLLRFAIQEGYVPGSKLL